MASEFQKVLYEIRKRNDKYEDIEDVKGEIIDNLVDVYKGDSSLFICDIEEGGFDTGNLNTDKALRVIVSNFLIQCNRLNIDKLYKIFRKLYKRNDGIKLLKEIRYLLEEYKNPEINIPTYRPSLVPLIIPTPTIDRRQESRVQWQLELSCNFDEIDDKKMESIINYCRRISGDSSLTLKRKERGSIKLIFEGSQEGMERIKALFDSGTLTAILEIPVTNISLITEQKLIAQKILFLSANPKGSSQLRLDEEMREIKEGLLRSKKREQFVIETKQAVRYREIRRAILDFEPNIVHFSGHGAGEEGLVFEDETGQEKLVEAEALAGLFKLFANEIKCVVLNACYSEVQAKAIARHIPSVVGMKKAISDRAAIEFAIGFYDGLGAGKTAEFAYELGCNSIEIAGIPGNLIPQLLKKNSQGTPPTQGNLTTDIQKRSSNTYTAAENSTNTDKILAPIYKNLEGYLANEQWKEADIETMKLMIKLADSIGNSMKDRKIITWLDQEDIKKIPDEDLKIIDKLWRNYIDIIICQP
ncbi:MAG: CHAT domain-containing protein [Okeania sp. SIO3B5]|uniref:CHAT domain-containing protein n=1 Tax=Okeania sp. SIO3B5 TaxID=2607811 RepID=UPI00140101FA|nr:CHAT domain-containing protein [Okeania sp. SIO3B5]NEO54353.1 CHAT domain-containing protein [Okeania sp. SIO3B5]